MINKYILGIDIGTSGCKSIIVDAKGNITSSATVEYPLFTPRAGWSEQRPKDWWVAVISSIRQVLAKGGIDGNELAGVGLSGQMHGMVALDAGSNVLRPAILWNDQRTVKQCENVTEAAGGFENLLTMTNNPVLPGYTVGKIVWMREQEPQLFDKARMFLNPKDYIRFLLTGEYATEVSDASGTCMFDVKNRCWCNKLLSRLDISPGLLPRVYESSEVSGRVSAWAEEQTGLPRGLPVVGGGGDAVVQTIGTGIVSQGVLGTTIGTSGIIAIALDSYKKNTSGNLQIFCNSIPDKWHLMGVTLSAGGSYRWCRDVFFKYEKQKARDTGVNPYLIMDAEASAADTGSKRLIFLPYLSGERCPYTDPSARGTFVGLTLNHSRAEITRAVMEGVVYSLLNVYESITSMDSSMMVSEIRASGGGSMSNVWRQVQADIFQLPVRTVSGSAEGGAYGAALVAGVGLNFWHSIEEAVGNLKIETENLPNPGNKAIYQELYSIYKGLYPSLRHTFNVLSSDF